MQGERTAEQRSNGTVGEMMNADDDDDDEEEGQEEGSRERRRREIVVCLHLNRIFQNDWFRFVYLSLSFSISRHFSVLFSFVDVVACFVLLLLFIVILVLIILKNKHISSSLYIFVVCECFECLSE